MKWDMPSINWRIGLRIKKLIDINRQIRLLEEQKKSIATELQHLRRLKNV